MDVLTAALLAVEDNAEQLRGKAGRDGTAGKDGTGLTWRGPWVAMTTYGPGGVVETGGSAYIAITTTSRKPPGPDWELFAARGSDGVSASFPRGLASGVRIDDEGTVLNNGGLIGELDFAGAGVSAAISCS